MHVIIVGGGIAGLATAVALRADNRKITVLERSSMLKETGALISLQPNASKIMTSWGLDPILRQYEPIQDTGFRMFDASGKMIRSLPLDTSRFGADRILYHRQDLHRALVEAATGSKLPGLPAVIRTGAIVTVCDVEKASVTLSTGESIAGDLVVGADGIRSVIRDVVVQEPWLAKRTGTSAYRMLIPSERLEGLDIPFDLLEPMTTMIIGNDRRVIMGPGRGRKLLGIVALIPDDMVKETPSDVSWNSPGSVDTLLDAYKEFPPWLHSIFRASEEVALWQLRDIDPLPLWVRGRTIVVGDAAHAMLPTQGQGASQSIEDAEALQAFLGSHSQEDSSQSSVTDALHRVCKVRHARASLIQQYSRQQAAGITKSTDGPPPVQLDPGEFMEYNCNYHGAVDWEKRQAMGKADAMAA